MGATMKDIARETGLGLATISSYLNGGNVREKNRIKIEEAVAELGMKGSILCVAGLFPQFLFYVPAVLVLLRFCWNYPQNQWNRQKTFFVCGLFLIGIFSESCLNPWLIQQIVNILF